MCHGQKQPCPALGLRHPLGAESPAETRSPPLSGLRVGPARLPLPRSPSPRRVAAGTEVALKAPHCPLLSGCGVWSSGPCSRWPGGGWLPPCVVRGGRRCGASPTVPGLKTQAGKADPVLRGCLREETSRSGKLPAFIPSPMESRAEPCRTRTSGTTWFLPVVWVAGTSHRPRRGPCRSGQAAWLGVSPGRPVERCGPFGGAASGTLSPASCPGPPLRSGGHGEAGGRRLCPRCRPAGAGGREDAAGRRQQERQVCARGVGPSLARIRALPQTPSCLRFPWFPWLRFPSCETSILTWVPRLPQTQTHIPTGLVTCSPLTVRPAGRPARVSSPAGHTRAPAPLPVPSLFTFSSSPLLHAPSLLCPATCTARSRLRLGKRPWTQTEDAQSFGCVPAWDLPSTGRSPATPLSQGLSVSERVTSSPRGARGRKLLDMPPMRPRLGGGAHDSPLALAASPP